MKPEHLIALDGSEGEGGGQVLRSSLSLSMITGTPFRIDRIRAKRAKPGLLRQHLTAVEAARAICGAKVEGAELGSSSLQFIPGPIQGGDYRFAIGSAGSCTLVLQTALPALWFADSASRISVSGGTHNQAAPPFDFLQRAWAPLLARMGIRQSLQLNRHGFYPAGGGEIVASIEPAGKPQPLDLCERGELLGVRGEALVAAVPVTVANRELDRLSAQLGAIERQIRELPAREGPGNVALVEVRYANVTEVLTAFGEKGRSAELVADDAGQQARLYMASSACVDEHLADQLALAIALAGSGSFTTTRVSGHLSTNIEVIEKFLPVEFTLTEQADAIKVSVA
ncbi:RNA 3'-terminal phosphate cyclase [Parachitinimonas caeni]|uniref:RNA 3'-terminal phosphate cyclase n=1 Tax=Parachitinimonas caeni TaxID=3031301 RepID=A0ABT7DYT7_9NEIS|nr:RNA 3'-terminal phosphate cyclase [Parachitinimonas caeni]MDK2125225.1 RNA 3'-terminal phosphate cyclase [Parachitinimonas caeni]